MTAGFAEGKKYRYQTDDGKVCESRTHTLPLCFDAKEITISDSVHGFRVMLARLVRCLMHEVEKWLCKIQDVDPPMPLQQQKLVTTAPLLEYYLCCD